MTTKEHLLKYLDYNSWANQKLCSVLAELPEEKWNAEITSSFSSVRKTLLHTLDGQIVWLTRLNGNSITEWPSANFSGTNNDIITRLSEHSEQFAAYFKSKNDNYFESHCVYNDFKGNSHSTLITDIIQHIMNHSTFHRGQLVTMLRQLGVEKIPSTDYIVYAREKKF